MTLQLRTLDLKRLNSATKYPSIPTYHELDPKNGLLLENAIPFEGEVLVTEKVDGTNARMVFFPDGDFVIGSREELLYARGDLIGNPALGIVDALKGIASEIELAALFEDDDTIVAIYGEVYGGKVTSASKQYTSDRSVGYRVFDVIVTRQVSELLQKTPQVISSWREHGGQQFVHEKVLQEVAAANKLQVTPRMLTLASDKLPLSVEDAAIFLDETIPESLSCLDDQAPGQAEGVVIRSLDRKAIAKVRFDDYRRTLRKRK